MQLGDRMKLFEGIESDRILLPGVPILARLDGKAFHTLTRGLERPFCKGLHDLMQAVTRKLVDVSGAVIGYTQSDEITLVFSPYIPAEDRWFGGRVQKLTSLLASYASVEFNARTAEYGLTFNQPGLFDCRVWSVPNKAEAVNCLIWREQDATKNSINSVAQSLFSHKSLQGLDGNQLQEKMWQERQVNWNDYPAWSKRGSYVRRSRVERPFTVSELESLPPQHNAHKNPNLLVSRVVIERMDMPILSTVENREAVVFDGAEPCQ